MASLTLSAALVKTHSVTKSHHFSRSFVRKAPQLPFNPKQVGQRRKTLPLLCSTNLPPWQPSHGAINEDDTITKRTNFVDPIDSEDSPQLTSIQNHAEQVFDLKPQPSLQQQPLKWPMWLLGPLLLLVTGIVPTLWLPLSSVFLGPNVASLLALIGLDCIFNMGATLFLLMADSCAKSDDRFTLAADGSHFPLTYRLWNLGASGVGFVVPVLMLVASHRGVFQQRLPWMSFGLLLGPYLLLLSTQVLTETLTWRWRSPVWLLTPVVYEGYRVLQLMRGLQLGAEVAVPAWVVESMRGLVAWWVLVLGVQLMRVAWYVGLDLRGKTQTQGH